MSEQEFNATTAKAEVDRLLDAAPTGSASTPEVERLVNIAKKDKGTRL